MEIIKSPNDRRQFKHVKLPNDLDVLLVSDPKTKTSCASLSVGIGSYHDNVEGIAHFLEHMLFIGSQKYPNENEYNLIVNANNGYSNAFTANDHTNYHFECVPEGLFKVLDVFAQFFIAPLLNENSIQNEMHAVNSEYINSLTNEYWRTNAATKKFVSQFHPESKFNMGSLETLSIPNIRDHVVDFYNKYYSSNIMKLIVVGKESLDELETFVAPLFSQVHNKNINLNKDYGYLFDFPVYGKIVSLKDERKLEINWEFELDPKYDMYHLSSFMGHIIGHEGPGSLFDQLHRHFLAKSLTAGVDIVNKSHKILGITITLTEKGFNSIDLVIELVTKYINIISNSSFEELCELYNENKFLRETKFKNYEVPNPLEFSTSKSSLWVTENIDVRYLISLSYIYNDYDETSHYLLIRILSQMKYENSNIFISAQNFDNIDEFSVEKWYKVKYLKQKHDPIRNLLPDIELTLPDKNKYICKNNEIIKENMVNPHPTRLDIPNMDLWWKFDNSYNIPDIDFICKFNLNYNDISLKELMLIDLFSKCLEYHTNCEIYNIGNAYYNGNISSTTNGFQISVRGYPEKFMLVLDFLITSMLTFKSSISNETFDNIKTIYLLELNNYKYKSLPHITRIEMSTKLIKGNYHIDETITSLESITYIDFLNYNNFIIGPNPNIYGLIQGNILENDAKNICYYLIDKFKLPSLNSPYQYANQFKEIIQNEFYQIIENDKEENSSFKLSIKIGHSVQKLNPNCIKESCLIDILDNIISEQYFDQLRTKEQLGYIVQSSPSELYKNWEQPFGVYNFYVQSPNKNSKYLKERTMQFIKEFRPYLEGMSESDINEIINSKILQLGKPFQNFASECQYNYHSIGKFDCKFDIKQMQIDYLQTVVKNDLLAFYDEYFSLKDDSYWSMSLESKMKL
jgi:insulysin